jgi:hypothetical protein
MYQWRERYGLQFVRVNYRQLSYKFKYTAFFSKCNLLEKNRPQYYLRPIGINLVKLIITMRLPFQQHVVLQYL